MGKPLPIVFQSPRMKTPTRSSSCPEPQATLGSPQLTLVLQVLCAGDHSWAVRRLGDAAPSL